MMRFLKRLFAIDDVVDESNAADESRQGWDAELALEVSPRSPRNGTGDRYFDTLLRLREAIANQEYEDAAKLARLNLSYIPGWVKESCQQDGSLRVTSIPALEQGGTILALVGDLDGLTSMQEIVESTAELEPWAKRVERHQDDLRLFELILDAVGRSPGCLQTDVKGLIDEEDGRRGRHLDFLPREGRKDR